MRLETLGTLLPLALVAMFLAQGCAKKEPTDAGKVASAPAAPAAGEPPAEAAAATTDAAAPDTAAAAPAPATPDAASTAAPADLAAGQKVYATFCSTCHGPAGQGDGPAAAALNPKPTNFAAAAFKYDANGNGTKGDVDDIKAIVHDGAAKHGGSPLMAPWPMITPDQLQAVAEYVRSLHGG